MACEHDISYIVYDISKRELESRLAIPAKATFVDESEERGEEEEITETKARTGKGEEEWRGAGRSS